MTNYNLSVNLILKKEKENREWGTYAKLKHHLLCKIMFAIWLFLEWVENDSVSFLISIQQKF